MVRKHDKPLEQVVKRYQEFLSFNEPNLLKSTKNVIVYNKQHNNGPLFDNLTSPQFNIVIKDDFKINIMSISEKLYIYKVFNINCYHPVTKKNVFLAKMFEEIYSFFDKPIDSLKLCIAVVNNLSKHFVTIDIESTEYFKYIVLNDNRSNKIIAYPILHSHYF